MTATTRPDRPSAAGQPDPFRYGEAYSVAQAARLAGVAPATVRRWLATYGPAGTPTSGVSFLQLVEIVVAAQFRHDKRFVSLDRLRRVHAFLQERLDTLYPLASLDLRERGGQLLHGFDQMGQRAPGLAVDVGGQWAMPGCVTRTLERIDYSAADRLAERWFPAGRDVPIVLDPQIGAGRLTVFGTGVTVETISGRFQAGDTIEHLAADYDLDEAAIQEAIRFANRRDLAVA